MPNTTLKLFKPNVIANGKFIILNNYGWILTPADPATNPDYPFVKIDGSLSKVVNLSGCNIRQDFILTVGKTYRLRFTMQGFTTGNIRCKTATVYYDPAQVVENSTFLIPLANGDYDVTFTSEGNSFYMSFGNAVECTLYNFSIVETPEVFILDTSDDVDVPLNFNIDDITKLNTRKTSFSKSIVLPGTHNNNQAFDHIYKANSETSFNPNFKSKVVIENHGLQVFEGVLCLDSITHYMKQNIENIKYSVSVYGESLSLFERLGDKAISELDFSMYDHEFTLGRINASWNNDIKLFGAYGAENRTLDYTSPTFTHINLVAANDYYVNYIGGAFVEIPFTAPHTFVEGDDIYIDSNNFEMFGDNKVIQVTSSTSVVISVVKWWAGATPSVSGTCYKYPYKGIGYWYPMTDNGKYQMITAGPPLVVGRDYYIKQAIFPDDFTNVGAPSNSGKTWFQATGMTPSSFVNLPNDAGTGTTLYQIDPARESLASHDSFINHWVVDDYIPHIFAYEVLIKMFTALDITLDAPDFETQFFKRIVMPLDQKFSLQDVQTSGSLVIGQQYMLYDYVAGDNFLNVGATGNFDGAIFNASGPAPTVWTNKTKVAAMVNFNNWLPKMKLKDFFLSMLNMMNLVFYEDVENKKILHVRKRTEFFSSEIVDWSDKLQSNEIMKMSMSNKILPTYYEFKYADSSDYFNTNYNEDYANQSNNYGVNQIIDRKYIDQPIFNRADFAKTSNTIEINFEPTIQAGPIQPLNTSGVIISAGIYADSDKTISPCYYADDDGSNIKRQSANRLFLISIKGTSTKWTFTSEGTPAEDILDVRMGAASTRFYPWAGHTDEFNSYSIMFGPPLKNYSTIPNPTKRGLYTQYWKRYVDEVNNINSKIVECILKLNTYDIYNIDFTKLYRVGDYVMKLNKVTDWNVNGDGTCKVEFLLKN